MRAPDYKVCSEEELWKFIGYHLSKAGIESVLVGGAVVAVYSKGAYRSGDLDFVTQKGTNSEIQKVLENLGFQGLTIALASYIQKNFSFSVSDIAENLSTLMLPQIDTSLDKFSLRREME
jgi:hypothetical protein